MYLFLEGKMGIWMTYLKGGYHRLIWIKKWKVWAYSLKVEYVPVDFFKYSFMLVLWGTFFCLERSAGLCWKSPEALNKTLVAWISIQILSVCTSKKWFSVVWREVKLYNDEVQIYLQVFHWNLLNLLLMGGPALKKQGCYYFQSLTLNVQG